MAVEYIGKNTPDGTCFGLTSSEKIAFFGATPSAQVAIAALASAATIATTTLQVQLIQAELESKGLIG